MQRKSNIRLLIAFATLIVVNVSLYFLFTARETTDVDDDLFKVEDFTKIDEVILMQKENPVKLKYLGGSWTVNSQLADRRMIDVLFATLQQAQPKRPVAESIRDSTNAILENEGVVVKLLANGELQKEFIVGGNPAKTQTYFKQRNSNKSYVAIIPGYRVYVGGIFELDESGWKDKYVFNFNWRNFQSLTFKVPSDSKSDFEINMGKNYYEVKGIVSVDTTKLNDFLDAVSLLTVDQYLKKDNVPYFDSLGKATPRFELIVTDVSGKAYSVAFYEDGTKDRLLGQIQGSQLAIFDPKKLTAIAKSRKWFEKK